MNEQILGSSESDARATARNLAIAFLICHEALRFSPQFQLWGIPGCQIAFAEFCYQTLLRIQK
jgi:hypothetical protein